MCRRRDAGPVVEAHSAELCRSEDTQVGICRRERREGGRNGKVRKVEEGTEEEWRKIDKGNKEKKLSKRKGTGER
jgi:hypothetical protein